MSSKIDKARRKQRKIKATRFANNLDKREAELWINHKRINPYVKCNADFQTKVEKYET